MIYFVRHGQTDDNLNKIYTGQKDIPLNKTGIEQAKQVAEQLSDIKFDVCFCSPLTRAKQTCKEILAFQPRTKVFYDDRLKERDYGELVNLPMGSIKFNRWKIGEDEPLADRWKVEKIMSVYKRVAEFYDEILSNYKNKNILIVAHSGIGRVGSAYFNDMPADQDFSSIEVPNANVVMLDK